MPVAENTTTDDLTPPSNHMKADQFPENWKAILTIEDINVEEYKDRDDPSKAKKKIVISWVGKEKTYVCNATNKQFLEAALGKRLMGWIGAKVKMARGRAKFNGQMVPSFMVVGAEPGSPPPREAGDDTDGVPF